MGCGMGVTKPNVIAWLEETPNGMVHDPAVLDRLRTHLESEAATHRLVLAEKFGFTECNLKYHVFELRCLGFPVQAQGEGYFIDEVPIETGVYVQHVKHGPGRVRFAREGFPNVVVDFRTQGIVNVPRGELKTK